MTAISRSRRISDHRSIRKNTSTQHYMSMTQTSDVHKQNMESVEEYSSCFFRMMYLWKENKKEEFRKQMQENLSASLDPYKMAFVTVKLCPDLLKCKQDSFAANILVELQTFMNQGNNAEKFESFLSDELQQAVYEVAVRQKNTGVLKLLVKAFHLMKNSERYLPSLKIRQKQGQYKEVCLLASLLNLQAHFTTSELLVPLFLEDRLSLADDLLESSPTHQKELLVFIDDIIGKKISMADLQMYKIKDTKKLRSNKILSGVLAKLLKRFGIEPTLCPHFQKFRATGGLRYLFYKYYIEKTLQRSTFYSLIDETLQESPDINRDLMNLFVEYCDPQGALPYVTKLKLSPANIPQQVREAGLNFPHLLEPGGCMEDDEQSQQEDWDSEIGNYFSLDTPQGEIVIIDSVDKFEEYINNLKVSPLLAIDAEWKPSFGVGPTEQAALLQFATTNEVFLLDLLSLQPVLQDSHWQSVGQLFSDAKIAKLGYGIRGDFRVLGSLHTRMKEGIVGAQNVIDFDITKGILVEEHPNIFSHNEEVHKGLSDLIYRCFGLPLDKRERFSNWAARPLTRSQVTYAALDVRCLINVYNYLTQIAAELHLPDWKTVKRRPAQAAKKAKPQPSVNVVKASTSHEPQQRDLVRAGDFRVVCDTMVQGLAKKLRSCGVDAAALATGEGYDHCLEHYQREGRVVLTRGSCYQALTRHIPPQYLYQVKSEDARRRCRGSVEARKEKMAMNVDMSLDDDIHTTKMKPGSRRGRGGGAVRGMRGRGRDIRRGIRGNRGRADANQCPMNGSRQNFGQRGNVGGQWSHDMYQGRGGGGGAQTQMSGPARLHISNLGFRVSDSDIHTLFAGFETMRNAAVHYDRSGRSLGTAHVMFERHADALNAIKQYIGVHLDGWPINITLEGGAVGGGNTRVAPPIMRFSQGLRSIGSGYGGGRGGQGMHGNPRWSRGGQGTSCGGGPWQRSWLRSKSQGAHS